MLVRYIVGVNQHADTLVGLRLGGFGRRGGGGVGLAARRFGGAAGGRFGGAAARRSGGFLGLGSGHGGKGPYPCDESLTATMRNAGARGRVARLSAYYRHILFGTLPLTCC